MTQRQAFRIIALNAGISLLISVLVVWVVRPMRAGQETAAYGVPSSVPARTTSLMSLSPRAPDAASAPTPIVHQVREGETLIYIAMKYGVSSEEIIEVNALVDPDVLAVGQELIIPAPELEPTDEPNAATLTPPAVQGALPPSVTPVPTSPTEPRPSPTASATPAGEYHLEITQILAPGRQETEVLELANFGREARLQGWTLSNGRGQVYTFPRLTLYKDSRVRIYTTKGRNSASDLYWGLDSAAWGSGVETATLKDSEGEVQATRAVQ
jgi:LysM repeat protein